MKNVSHYKTLISLILSFLFPLAAQQDDQIIREEVSVANVEVPVRVFYKNKPVDNLTKSDFQLYEGGKKQRINGFYLKRKTIAAQHYEMEAEREKRKSGPSRYFALIFNLSDFQRNLEKGLDYTFDNILREDDQLLVMINDKTFFYEDLSDKEIIRRNIKSTAKEEGESARKEMLDYLKRIERKTDELKHLLKADEDAIARAKKRMSLGGAGLREKYIKDFLNDYYIIWKEFKKKYFMPGIDKFYHFSKHLERIKREKWVINFHQLVQFPQLKQSSEEMQKLIALLDTREYHKMNFDLVAATDFPTEDVSKLFYKVNATFHSILIPSQKDILSEDLTYREISTVFENFLRDITKKTGGELISSANLISALDTIRESEDIYYMLTYEPGDPKKIGKIKVVVTDETYKYKVLYDKNMRAAYIRDYLAKKNTEDPEIKISEMSFEGKTLTLIINNFLQKEEKKITAGRINVNIVVEDKDGKMLFDKSHLLTPEGKPTSLKIDFNRLNKGKYYILADVRDEFTGRSQLEFVQAEIGDMKTTLSRVEFSEKAEEKEEEVSIPLSGDKELDKYLLGAAQYCEKLRKNAFHFYCKEKIESILDLSDLGFRPEEESRFWKNVRDRKMNTSDKMKSGKRNVRVYVFDYQIVSSNGKVSEQRKLISKKTGVDQEEKDLQGKIDSFLAERAIFGPVTLLSQERQDSFNFKLLKYEKYKKKHYAVIEATPKNKNVNFSYGKVWVNSEDFSVLKIKVDPRSIKGYRSLQQMARKLQARLFLTCEIEYNMLHNGLRFPTRVLVEETYKGGPLILRMKGYRGWERNKTIFVYKDYKFFDVEVEVTND
jgi:hypothetical protein